MDNSSPKIYTEFLPISRADMEARGWEQLDFVVVGGDAYVDHPSFGTAIISRLLEAEGYKIGVLAQPRYTDCEDFKRFGKPKYGFFIGGGNVDSMVSHYSVAKIPRAEDEYSPRRQGRRTPGPQRHRVHPPCQAGLSRPSGDSGRSGGVPAPLCPLRLLAGHRPAQHRRGFRRGHHQLWHGRAPDRGDRPPPCRRGAGGEHHGRGRHLLHDRLRPSARALRGVRRL